jgi:uncharacterized membrane protein
MLFANLTFLARDWIWPAAGAIALGALVLVWAYRNTRFSSVRWICAMLKFLGVTTLALCLLEPFWSGQRARPGANLFAIVADNSQGLQIKDSGETRSRGECLAQLVGAQQSDWQAALEDNFEVRRFFFDSRLQSTRDFHELDFNGQSTSLGSALRSLKERFVNRPLAGVLMLTDGNATDLGDVPGDFSGLPPIYPVVIGRRSAVTDAALNRVNITQSAFEDAPVTVQAEVTALGMRGESLTARLLDASGKHLEESTLRVRKDEDMLAFRFQFRPEKPGLSFYRLDVHLRSEITQTNPAMSTEATLLNNSRVLAIDRGKGPYRILYVSGRPNWEYKFLNRALEEDREVQFVGLIRIALREPKFDFRGRGGETSNPLFRGFGNQAREDTERYDQPVLIRLNTRDEFELRGGFPSAPEDLFGYHAVILDDLEVGFFSTDQQVLLQRFVAERGGGLLMLGGMESFQQGNYFRTPIGDMLPMYLDRTGELAPPGPVKLNLTPEGFLQSWARLREKEGDEKTRLQQMPAFQVFNPVRTFKPGASVIATATDERGTEYPALLTQRFGRGRTAAFAVGDFWRWGMLNPTARLDMEKAWRQLARWLVSDVPKPVELAVESSAEGETRSVNLQVRARDPQFQPLEEATVLIEVEPVPATGTNPVARPIRLRAEPSLKEPGVYEAGFVAREAGGYLARALVTNSAGLEVGRVEAGWATDLAADEFRSLQPNFALLEDLARRTGGGLVSADDLAAFARRLPARTAPVMEPWTTPAWHTPAVFAFALACFVAEWGLRRWKGMP